MGAGEIERLKQLLKRPENKTCADCNTKQPRWASINLGCFICIRCSGIHRSIGVHVSKVRSVTLDDWQSAWVDNMEKWGNKKVNQLYESKIGNTRKPDATSSDREIEHFIRQKYEHKAFMGKESTRKSKIERVSSEEESDSDESDTTESSDTTEEEKIPPPKSNASKMPIRSKESQSSRSKATKTDSTLASTFENVSLGSNAEPFADFSQSPNPKTTSSETRTNSNDFGQFSDFFGAESKPANAAAAKDKDFIMSLFQSAPEPSPAQPGPYIQAGPNASYGQGTAPVQMPYSQQMMTGMSSYGGYSVNGPVPMMQQSAGSVQRNYPTAMNGFAPQTSAIQQPFPPQVMAMASGPYSNPHPGGYSTPPPGPSQPMPHNQAQQHHHHQQQQQTPWPSTSQYQ